MDCREAQTLLTAFHDGELSDADRARVENHLRGCPECGGLLADLARADEVAGVPDPGPGYWDRFNARVADRIEREAEGPKVAVLRPKQGWMRQQLRFLVPAVAAAALVVVVVRYGGRNPVAPKAIHPPAVSVTEQSALDSAGQRVAKGERELPAKAETEDAAVSRSLPAKSNRAAEVPAVSPPPIATERFPTVAREERNRLADRPPVEGKERTSRDHAAASSGIGAPSPSPLPTERSAPAASPPVTVPDERLPKARQAEGKKMAEAAPPVTEPQLAATTEAGSVMGAEKDQSAAEAPQTTSVGNAMAKAGPSPLSSEPTRASSPCEKARTLAAKERFGEAEAAQRKCLARNPSPTNQEKGLI
ncbi:MAG: zf-HC2 domain-containing protein, partial [Thermodesulfobacteriota bacterium]|nr:zf-HC2 domain-containing protein [Thermodesulfobacteriota bacterium]